ncbi:MAG: efflux RND transporter periplasmic adaptor subunit [Bacillota bacterium]|nr:efflux RND transporter periplasmic adaptor subunit [Bacillota bacterium]
MKRFRWVLVAIVVLVAIGWMGYSRVQRAVALQQQQKLAYSTGEVKRATLDLTVRGTANIVASDKRTVKSTVAGTVDRLGVKEGQPVKAGEPVVSLKNDTLTSLYDQAVADLQAQRIQLSAMTSPSSLESAGAKLRVQQAASALASRKKDVEHLVVQSPVQGRVASVNVNAGDPVAPPQVLVTVAEDREVLVMAQIAQADIGKVKIGQTAMVSFGTELPAATGTVDNISALASETRSTTIPVAVRLKNPEGLYRTGLSANASITVSADEKVYGDGKVSPIATHDLKAEVSGSIKTCEVREGASVQAGQVLLRIENDPLLVALQQAEHDLEMARDSLAKVSSGLLPGVTENDVRIQETRVRQVEAILRAREADAVALVAKSPIEGVVVTLPVSGGEAVSPGETLFAVADLSRLKMAIMVDELDITLVKMGQQASVTFDAIPARTFPAEVAKIASEGTIKEGVANYEVTLTFKDSKDLKPSMTGTARILVTSKKDALVVPAEAVRQSKGRKVVMVMKDGAPVEVEVTVGLSNNTLTEILSGVKEGDRVLLTSTQPESIWQMMPGGSGPR